MVRDSGESIRSWILSEVINRVAGQKILQTTILSKPDEEWNDIALDKLLREMNAHDKGRGVRPQAGSMYRARMTRQAAVGELKAEFFSALGTEHPELYRQLVAVAGAPAERGAALMNWYVLQVMTGSGAGRMHGAAAQGCVCPRPGPADGDPAAGPVARARTMPAAAGICVRGRGIHGGAFPCCFPCPRRHPVAGSGARRSRRRWTHGRRCGGGWTATETLEPSRVLFHADGTWHVLDGPLAAFAGCPVRMERRQRRAYVTAELGGVARRVRFGVIPVDGDAQ